MRAAVDGAGRLVIPEALRLLPGPVEVSTDGSRLWIQPITDHELVEEDRQLVIPRSGAALDDATVEALRRADQR